MLEESASYVHYGVKTDHSLSDAEHSVYSHAYAGIRRLLFVNRIMCVIYFILSSGSGRAVRKLLRLISATNTSLAESVRGCPRVLGCKFACPLPSKLLFLILHRWQ